MSLVTPEMIEAGQCAAYHEITEKEARGIYLAMKALDPEVEQLKARIRILSDRIEEDSYSLTRLADLAKSYLMALDAHDAGCGQPPLRSGAEPSQDLGPTPIPQRSEATTSSQSISQTQAQEQSNGTS